MADALPDAVAHRCETLSELEAEVIGDGADSMLEVELRLRAAFPSARAIAWEGDAATFQFTYVSPDAEALLGYSCARWLSEPGFWAETVVASEDRNDAVSYCALATAGRQDHVFEYRAVAADGRRLIMRDVVVVVVGKRGIPERLRGLMFDVTAVRSTNLTAEDIKARQAPQRAELERGPAS